MERLQTFIILRTGRFSELLKEECYEWNSMIVEEQISGKKSCFLLKEYHNFFS